MDAQSHKTIDGVRGIHGMDEVSDDAVHLLPHIDLPFFILHSELLDKEGWLRHQSEDAKPPLRRRRRGAR
jgi:hypothetical protein